ncbi:hypothetical protein EB118_25885, partial [bacterium]|nr:hypothetical protein [bacterium]
MNPTIVDNNSVLSWNNVMAPTESRMAGEQSPHIKFSPIMVYLQKYDQKDDILVIHRLSSSVFNASFYSHSAGYKFNQRLTSCDELIDYLDTFMTLQVSDHCACDFIQLDIPGMPAIILKPRWQEWQNVWPQVRRLLKNMTKSAEVWPKQIKL